MEKIPFEQQGDFFSCMNGKIGSRAEWDCPVLSYVYGTASKALMAFGVFMGFANNDRHLEKHQPVKEGITECYSSLSVFDVGQGGFKGDQ